MRIIYEKCALVKTIFLFLPEKVKKMKRISLFLSAHHSSEGNNFEFFTKKVLTIYENGVK